MLMADSPVLHSDDYTPTWKPASSPSEPDRNGFNHPANSVRRPARGPRAKDVIQDVILAGNAFPRDRISRFAIAPAIFAALANDARVECHHTVTDLAELCASYMTAPDSQPQIVERRPGRRRPGLLPSNGLQ